MSAAAVYRPGRVRWGRAAWVLLATLLVHAWLLDRVNRVLVGGNGEPQDQPAVTARLLPPPPAEVPEPPARPVAVRPTPRPRPAVRPPPVAVPAPEPVEVPPTPVAEEPSVAEPAPSEAEPEATPAAEPPAERIVEVFEAKGPMLRYALEEWPELRTALRGTARYVYRTTNSEIRLATGTTVIDWSLDDDGRYDLRLATTAVGIVIVDVRSVGTLRGFGLAPETYTERRVRRGASHTAFDWDNRRLSFSRRPHERPLLEGAQDRLSFQIQMMLLGRAQPGLFRKGAEMIMPMVGLDDVTEYRFRTTGRSPAETGIGRFDALHVERVTERDTDARVEVWLVPELGWLPVRLRFTDRLGRVTESVLESMQTS